MPDWFAPVVSVIALAFSVLSPLMLGFFDLRKAAQERKMSERREKKAELSQKLNELIEARAAITLRRSSQPEWYTYVGKAYAIVLSVPDRQMQELAPRIIAEAETSYDAIDDAIKRLGENLAEES